MPYSIDDSTATALVALHPRAARPGHAQEAPQAAALELIATEQRRRGQPDATGALHVLALTQGTLLKEQFDLSTHAHHDGWTVGAVMVDVKEMIHFNARFGFPAGDALLKALVASLAAQYPGARIVRFQPDGFAVLLVPTSQLTVREDSADTTRARLTEDLRPTLPPGAAATDVPGFTVALLELTVHQPSHWQVLGPLLWAEVERAYIMERTGRTHGLQRRHLRLDAFLPEPEGT
ncbi:diguanylate cyclase [Corallococcus praedator]|uniref:Diguanylate cyclase n=1 Tax=Corallococcus praedator TaxID=2316724 RepID=A0ABX9Q8H1_9BACT|nr:MULTISPECIES: diguanylate cyclase [Corallococcus]RKH04461.1 diguanylate cyclase [Corallococcus sp. CA047B]RKH19417.1 diguanylate cyclase [Corallococcus sp. CA031C]RKH92285.1 diguanylate cyclase [Corallococcus praedator]